MASSQNNLDEAFDDAFDDAFDELFDQDFEKAFDNFTIQSDQEEQRKKRKNELISKDILKKGIFVYEIIISVKLQRILKISSDDVLE